MRTVLRAFALLLPLILVSAWAPALWAGTACLAGGAVMGATAWFGPGWTAWASAPDWPGMTGDPLFARINRALSGLWGALFALTGLALLLGGGPLWRWIMMPIGGVISAALPRIWSERDLQTRLRDADPDVWPSPLKATAPTGLDTDVAVVGAGLGGLTAAALLARAGVRVTVFEQHDKPGGFCHNWEAMGSDEGQLLPFRFDGGVHDISGCFAGGSVHELLSRLNLQETVEWRRLDHAFIDTQGRWDVPRGWAAFTEALAQRHPDQAPNLRRLLADVRAIFEAMYATTAHRGGVPGQPATVQALKEFARAHPLAVQWMQRPFSQLLHHHGVTGAARAQLLALSGYVTHDAGSLRVRDAVPLLGYFLHGGHYPVGGSGALARALADSLALDGATLELGVAVQAVELAPAANAGPGAPAPGVQAVRLADGRRVRCRAVVLAGDAPAALRLLEPADQVPPALRERLAALRPATSMFMVHLGVRGEAPALPPVVHLHGATGPVEIVLPCTVDPSAAPPGYFTVELMRLVPPGQAAAWFQDAEATDPRAQRASDAYLARKTAEGDAMIAAAAKLIPGLRERVVLRREASPVTFRRYAWGTQGSIYGAVGPDGRLAPLPRGSPIHGLVFAGASAAGPGAEPAMMSGAEAADALWPGLLTAEAAARDRGAG